MTFLVARSHYEEVSQDPSGQECDYFKTKLYSRFHPVYVTT